MAPEYANREELASLGAAKAGLLEPTEVEELFD